MSMQINVDPAGLTQEQREAVAGFILAYPSKACGGTCHSKQTLDLEVRVDTSKATAAVDALAAHTHAAGLPGAVTDTLDPEIAALVKDDGEFQASVAFGSHGSPALDADAAKLNAIFGQGAAGPTIGDVGLAPVAAFGSTPAPLPLGATAAPSIAVAAPSLTVPADTTATTFAAAPNVPAPPALNTAPAAPIAAPQTANPVGAVDLDKHGLPWDGRIHAESKAKIADGTWRKKRGVDPALVATVEAELRQVMGAAPAVPLAPVAPPPPAPLAAPVGEVPQDARAQFVGLVGRASAAIQAGKVTQAEITQCCAAAGVPALPLLANRLDLVAQVAAQVDAMIAAR